MPSHHQLLGCNPTHCQIAACCCIFATSSVQCSFSYCSGVLKSGSLGKQVAGGGREGHCSQAGTYRHSFCWLFGASGVQMACCQPVQTVPLISAHRPPVCPPAELVAVEAQALRLPHTLASAPRLYWLCPAENVWCADKSVCSVRSQ